MTESSAPYSEPKDAGSGGETRFLFATGIECSYPTIAGPDGRTVRVDELERTFHYSRWREDLALVQDLGIRHLRYGPPYYRVHPSPDRFDWEFCDLVFGEMQRLGLEPIVDLCHFGVPDWAGSFQNPDWPDAFARYAGAFAERYPWVRLYTPVNEIYVCAKLSTLAGIWNERKAEDERAFVTGLKHLCQANLRAIRAILRHRVDAIFIQSESAEYFHVGGQEPATVRRADWENQRRFLSFDLLYSVQPSAEMTLYLLDNEFSRGELDWFMSHGLGDCMVMGSDFYERNESVVMPGGEIRPAGEVLGWSVITRQYHERYRRPIMHTETNNIASASDPVRWLWKEFYNVCNLRDLGLPVIGFTWFSLVDQVDWDSGLALDRGVVNPVGLYDLSRRPRPVAEAFKEMVREFAAMPLMPQSAVFALRGSASPPRHDGRPKPKLWHTVRGRERPERAVVAIARTTDESVDASGVEALVRDALDHLGGMAAFVRPGQTVLIKPNQTIWRTAADGATTDPRLVAAIARLAREAGAGTVYVGECSSCGQVTREIMAATGMEAAAREAGAIPVYFDECEQVTVDVPEGEMLHEIPIPRPLLEADVVIACPKLKTHFVDPVTGALKLWVGTTRQDIMHRLHRDSVEETVADLLTVSRPDLAVMDAIVAGEGNGPVAVRPRFVGCVLASTDPVALDLIAGDLAGADGEAMRFVRAAAGRGVGVGERSRIEVRGETVEKARVPLESAQLDGWAESYPVRVIVGEGVTLQGTLGHFKGFADLWQMDHLWDVIVALRGRPTFMIGRAEDPDYEVHLKGGRYVVLDDAALDKYKRDPRVAFIPGSPIANEMMPAIMEALGISAPGETTEQLMKTWESLKAKWLYRDSGGGAPVSLAAHRGS